MTRNVFCMDDNMGNTKGINSSKNLCLMFMYIYMYLLFYTCVLP